MNKKVKILSVALCSSLAIASLAPVALASEATPSLSVELQKGEINPDQRTIVLGKDEFSSKILNSIEAMTPYVSKGQDNLYHIDPAAQNIVDQDVYEHFATGVQNLNVALNGDVSKSGSSLNLNAVLNSEVSGSNSSVITPYVFSNTYWWGVAITFDNEETIRMVYSLNQTAQVAVILAAIAAFIPSGQLGAVVAAIEGAGATMIANSMSYHNNGKGVTLNIHWLPITYFEVTTNQG
ncbi:hypothetical protein RJP21_16675 [Paenibacillus sp. VCA1]|uniref:hypothetical protein n=1 Tax=Paenibacillus sp. VCA1 TaxID=3039148 RepID=UPI00287157FF|nr:hypothetical protein [Paenibacillus sp. VCA1]MDR9855252.1 hypothetical protein [Paenibacillus sp. VCA1]